MRKLIESEHYTSFYRKDKLLIATRDGRRKRIEGNN
jgi:hypothetical protein